MSKRHDQLSNRSLAAINRYAEKRYANEHNSLRPDGRPKVGDKDRNFHKFTPVEEDDAGREEDRLLAVLRREHGPNGRPDLYR